MFFCPISSEAAPQLMLQRYYMIYSGDIQDRRLKLFVMISINNAQLHLQIILSAHFSTVGGVLIFISEKLFSRLLFEIKFLLASDHLFHN